MLKTDVVVVIVNLLASAILIRVKTYFQKRPLFANSVCWSLQVKETRLV